MDVSLSIRSENKDPLQQNNEQKELLAVIEQLKSERDEAIKSSSKYKKQLYSLKEAVQLLGQLISSSLSMFSSYGQNDPFKDQIPKDFSSAEQTKTIGNRIREDKSTESIQNQIHEIISTGGLDDTPLPSLATSIDRLHFRYRLVTIKENSACYENRLLLERLRKRKEENKHLEDDMKAMLKKNCLTTFFENIKEYVFNILGRKEVNSVAEDVKTHGNILSDNSKNIVIDVCDDENSIHSLFSTISTSSDDASTLHSFNQNNVNTFQKHCYQRKQQQVYKLSFLSGKKIGLQFQKVVVDHERALKVGMPSNQIKKKFKTNYEDSVTCSFSATDGAENVFIVCGFHGFDCNANFKPALGARIIAINEESLEWSQWTNETFRCMVLSKMASGSSLTMTFRNDPLNMHQRNILKKAVIAAAEQAVEFGKHIGYQSEEEYV